MQRTTDYARTLVRRAQLGLAALALPVALTVGLVVAGSGPATPISTVTTGSATSPVQPTPMPPLPQSRSVDRVVHLIAPSRTAAGTVAGLATLAICWTLLGAAGAVWRHRLDRRDLRAWADSWARVEPLWSDRHRRRR